MQGLLTRALHETKAMRFALGVMLQLFFEESIHSLLVPPCVVYGRRGVDSATLVHRSQPEDAQENDRRKCGKRGAHCSKRALQIWCTHSAQVDVRAWVCARKKTSSREGIPTILARLKVVPTV